MREPNLRFEFMPLMIVAVIFSAIFVTFLIAILTEAVLPGGYVRYAALLLFAVVGLTCTGGLAWFLKCAVYEWGSYRDIIPVDKCERVLLRTDERASHFEDLDGRYLKPVWVRTGPVDVEPLEDAGLDESLYNRLSNGGNSK